MAIPKVGLRKIKRKNGYVYQVDYTIEGKRYRETVGSNKRHAENYKAKIQVDIQNGKLGISKKEKISFQKLHDEYFQLNRVSLSAGTQKKYDGFVGDFKYFFGKYFPESLTDITKIKSPYIAESISNFTTTGARSGIIWGAAVSNSYKTFLAMLFKYAIGKEYLSKNPASELPALKVEKKSDIQFYSDDELNVIFGELDDEWNSFFTFLLNTGLRLGEALNLIWTNVNLESDIPKIIIASSGEWRTKTNDSRIVPLNNIAKQILLKQKQNGYEYVFTDNGNRIQKNKPLRELKKVLNKNGIKGDVHQFRHTFASNFIMKNKHANSLYDLANILGHKDTKTTRIYAHLTEEHLLGAVRNLE